MTDEIIEQYRKAKELYSTGKSEMDRLRKILLESYFNNGIDCISDDVSELKMSTQSNRSIDPDDLEKFFCNLNLTSLTHKYVKRTVDVINLEKLTKSGLISQEEFESLVKHGPERFVVKIKEIK